MPISSYDKLTEEQRTSISGLFEKVGDPNICFYIVDEDTSEITGRIPVKLGEYAKLMGEDLGKKDQ